MANIIANTPLPTRTKHSTLWSMAEAETPLRFMQYSITEITVPTII